MNRAFLLAAFAVAFVAGASAQAKPNFAGSWQIDHARSKFQGGALPESITVEGARMTITRTAAGNAQSIVYMLDGTPSKRMQGPAGEQKEVVYTSKWEGEMLVTTWTPSPVVTYSEIIPKR